MFDTKKYYLKNKKIIKEKHRKYYLENKEKIKLKRNDYIINNPNCTKEYYQKNKKIISLQHKQYYQNNKTKSKLKCKEWRKENPYYIKKWKTKNNYDSIYYKINKTSIDERHKRWEKDNPNKMRFLRRKGESKRRLKLKGFIFTNGITKRTQIGVWNECNGYCVYCKSLTNPISEPNELLQTTYDHIVEVSHLNPNVHRFDPNGRLNLVIACRSCNSKRNNKPINKWCEEIGFTPEIVKLKLETQHQQICLI